MPRPLLVRVPALLDQILAAEFGAVRGRSLLSATLDLNPGLADAGPFIPLGRTIVLPDRPVETTATRPVVSLFG